MYLIHWIHQFSFKVDTKLGIIHSLSIHPDAAKDLRELMAVDRLAAGKVLAMLEQGQRDINVLNSLLEQNFGAGRTEAYHVSKWWELWRAGYNLWRLKIWTFPRGSLAYRIVYAYDPDTLEYCVLAIVHRDFDYQIHHAVTQRILQAYEILGIARY